MDNINDFKKALQFTLKWEGGYSNDSDDPGGETKWGISKRSHPDEDIKNLTPERAAEIYSADYWGPAGCDSIPFPSNAAVFDTAVNCGISRATQWWGDSDGDVRSFLERRKQHYIQIINKNDRMFKYWKGWIARLIDLKKFVEVNEISR